MAEHANSKIGNLKEAEMGVFQITGQNTNEDYSWGGSFNTKAKHKTASISQIFHLNYNTLGVIIYIKNK